jgi:hypothetical protein
LPAISRLMKNAHLPFDRHFDRLRVPSKVEGLMALGNVEGQRYPYSSSLRCTSPYGSLLGISGALHLDVLVRLHPRCFTVVC